MIVKIICMKAIEIIEQLLEGTKVPEGKKYVLLLDLDDCLLTANNIHIIKIFPDGREVALTPDEYAKKNREQDKLDGVKYDYREFRDSKKVANSIISATPVLRNLRIVDSHINNGWTIGVLTARGLEDTVYYAVKKWLMYRDSDGELKAIGDKLTRELTHAVNDGSKVYSGLNDFDKKANVIRQYAKKFDRVKFLDDDKANLSAVRTMAKEEGLTNVQAINAWGKE
jgi:hypothetical protein